jgi:hypothetical protein
MEALIVLGATGLILYNSFYTEPRPCKEHAKGTALPNPRFLYSDPAQWTAAPVDISYRNYESFHGPNNDPRRRYILPGGARVVHSGYKPHFTQTNQIWPNAGVSAQPLSTPPSYTYQPSTGIGEAKRVTHRTVVSK